MELKTFFLTAFMVTIVMPGAMAGEYSYLAIAKRYSDIQLDAKSLKAATMQGECMVGLKQPIFIKRTDFDPVAEWINYRTLSLLEQFPPCTVLIMMQVARDELMGDAVQNPSG